MLVLAGELLAVAEVMKAAESEGKVVFRVVRREGLSRCGWGRAALHQLVVVLLAFEVLPNVPLDREKSSL